MKSVTIRDQCDYSLAFKLDVVDQVEKGASSTAPIRIANSAMERHSSFFLLYAANKTHKKSPSSGLRSNHIANNASAISSPAEINSDNKVG